MKLRNVLTPDQRNAGIRTSARRGLSSGALCPLSAGRHLREDRRRRRVVVSQCLGEVRIYAAVFLPGTYRQGEQSFPDKLSKLRMDGLLFAIARFAAKDEGFLQNRC